MSKIEWTEKTWNVIVGCSKVSAGCKNCYAERMACRLQRMYDADPYGKYKHLKKYLEVVGSNWRSGKYDHWNGKTYFDESALSIPLKRKKATTYFVCSMGDLFHESVPFEWIDKVMFTIYKSYNHGHTFQILTKRPERMAEYFLGDVDGRILELFRKSDKKYTSESRLTSSVNMLPRVWLGTTAENQEMADKRIPELLKCPAAKRFVSIEPMLSAVNFRWMPYHHQATGETYREYLTRKGSIDEHESLKMLDWVICGCESGPGARAMLPHWARSLRNQCKSAGVAFFMKQLHFDGKFTKDINEFPKDLRIREYPNSGE